MVNPYAHMLIKATRLTKERSILMAHAALAVAGSRLLLGIRLSFLNHAPQQSVNLLAIHTPATNQIGGDKLHWSAEERLGECRESA